MRTAGTRGPACALAAVVSGHPCGRARLCLTLGVCDLCVLCVRCACVCVRLVRKRTADIFLGLSLVVCVVRLCRNRLLLPPHPLDFPGQGGPAGPGRRAGTPGKKRGAPPFCWAWGAGLEGGGVRGEAGGGGIVSGQAEPLGRLCVPGGAGRGHRGRRPRRPGLVS